MLVGLEEVAGGAAVYVPTFTALLYSSSSMEPTLPLRRWSHSGE